MAFLLCVIQYVLIALGMLAVAGLAIAAGIGLRILMDKNKAKKKAAEEAQFEE